ncbi:MAG: hypothetical protein ACK4M1_09440 [Flavobacterium sp.]|mgnify:CR=1 FL=1
MKTNFLFPNYLKMMGWILFFLPILITSYFWISGESMDNVLEIKTFAIYDDGFIFQSGKGFLKMTKNGMLDELLLVVCLLGGLLVGFSKTKNEDEMIAHIRYTSLVWATYFNIIMMIITTLFVFGMVYFNAMIFFMISSLLFFIIRFNYMIYKLNKVNSYEE